MKLTFISDTHNRHDYIRGVTKGDIIFHCGDATVTGYPSEVKAFLKWFEKLPYEHKVFIPGNHDFAFEESADMMYDLFNNAGVHLLIDESVTIDGIKIWGSPYTPWFNDWAFNRARNGIEASLYGIDFIFPHWDKIPNDTDILLTHGPPYDILDQLRDATGKWNGQFVGCQDLAERLEEVKPKIHAFGHIHGNHGALEKDGTLYINASSLDKFHVASVGWEAINVEYDNGVISYNAEEPKEIL